VVPWKRLDTAVIPGGGELRLMRRGREFSIMLGQNELMNSRITASEEALAALACERIGHEERPAVLIGGLGMGFTLRAALSELGPNARIVVAELVPAIVRWARGPMAELFGLSLADPRVTVHEGDVASLVQRSKSAYDAILLDVDNGPEGLTLASNERLYDLQGLNRAREALRPGGVLAVWSSGPDRGFSERLRKPGFEVYEVSVRASGARGRRHIVWIAKSSDVPRPQRTKRVELPRNSPIALKSPR
jgi:spermidine synthase